MRSGGDMIELEPRAAAHLSPRALSRIGGALYLTIIAIGAFGEMGIRSRIVVPGDASATATNGGHTFPQPHARFPRLLGRTHGGNGPAEIWSFFSRRPGAPTASVRTHDTTATEEP
jgi:hypothetical protein